MFSQYLLFKLVHIEIKLLGIITVGFDVTDEIMIRFLYSSDTREKMVLQCDSISAIHRLQESVYLIKREVLHNILIEFGVLVKLVRLIKICLKETCNKASIGKHLSGKIRIQNVPKQLDALAPLLFNLL
jgi:hypothetical protein